MGVHLGVQVVHGLTILLLGVQFEFWAYKENMCVQFYFWAYNLYIIWPTIRVLGVQGIQVYFRAYMGIQFYFWAYNLSSGQQEMLHANCPICLERHQMKKCIMWRWL